MRFKQITGILAVIILLLMLGFVWIVPLRSPNQPGFYCRTFRTESGESVPYILFLPHTAQPDQPKPVLLFLNGYGENGSDGISQLSNNLGQQIWDTRGRFPFIVVAPQMSKDSAWTDPRSTVAAAAPEIVRQVISQFNGDPDRIYLTGPSSGGRGVLALAERHPQMFAAIAPTDCGGLRAAENLLDVPMWTFYNSGDYPELVKAARSGHEQLLLAGHSPIVTEFDLPGHTAWVFAYNQPILYDWFLRHRLSDRQRDERRNAPPRFSLVNPSQFSKFAEVRPDLWVVSNRQDNTCRMLLIPETGDQLHLQYKSSQEVACELALVAPRVSESPEPEVLAAITIPWPKNGSATIRSSTGEVVCGDSLAQRTLDHRIWNDIRVTKRQGVCLVQLNGANLMEAHLPDERLLEARFALRFSAIDSTAEQHFRYIRTGPYSTLNHRKDSRVDDSGSWETTSRAAALVDEIGTSLFEKFLEPPEAISLEQIRQGWESLEEAYASCRIEWQQEMTKLLSWYNGPWPMTEKLPNSSLEFRDSNWILRSVSLQTPSGLPEGMDVSPSITAFLPERENHLFHRQLFSRFTLPQPTTEFCQFLRQFSDGRLTDLATANHGITPKIVLHRLSEMGSANHALFNFEKPATNITAKLTQANARCLTLDQSAAVLALRPLTGLFGEISQASELGTAKFVTNGVECYRVVELFGDSADSRIWMVATQPPHPVIRYIGTAGDESVQIDFRWDMSCSPPRPLGWETMLCWTTGRPTNYFGRSTVHQIELTEPQSKPFASSPMQLSEQPVGTWVDDRQQNKEYLIVENGQQRTITLAEQCWLPTVDELLQSDSGLVDRVIQRKILWRKWTSGIRGWTTLGLLCGCGLLLTRVVYRKMAKSAD